MLNLEKLDLSKKAVLDLVKTKGMDGQIAKVILCIDKSGSMQNLYLRGFVQSVIERVIPIAMAFDDDQTMEVYGFHHGKQKLKDVNLNNLEGYVRKEIETKMDYGATNYAPALKAIFEDFLNDSSNTQLTKSGGFLGLGGKTTKSVSKYPAFVIFITDGENSDKSATQKVITEMASHGLFVQFIGLKSSFSDNFKFLKTLDTMPGRFIDNANFFEISDKRLLEMSDDDLYNELLSEFPDWVKLAKSKGIIK